MRRIAWIAGFTAALLLTITAHAGERPELIVHVGTTDGARELALGKNPGSVVHGLARDEASVAKAREAIRKAGAYGRVSVRLWRGAPKLPYIDSIINRVVVAGGVAVDEKELQRVLAPNGVIERGGKVVWTAPIPKELSTWPHVVGPAGGTRFTPDERIGKPVALRWLSGPMFNIKPKVAADGVVIAMTGSFSRGGRSRVARPERVSGLDAFNGLLLWQRELPFASLGTRPETWGGEDRERVFGYCYAIREGKLYTATSPKATILDLYSGKALGTLETEGAPERVMAVKNAVVVSTDKEVASFAPEGGAPRWSWKGEVREALADDSIVVVYAANGKGHFLMGLSPDAGKKVWEWRPKTPPAAIPEKDLWKVRKNTPPASPIRPVALGYGRVFVWKARYVRCVYANHASDLVCLDSKTGKELWRHKPTAKGDIALGYANHVMADESSVWTMMTLARASALVKLDAKTGAEQGRATTHMLNPHCQAAFLASRIAFPRDYSVERDAMKVLGNNKLSIRAGCGSTSVPAYGMIYTGAHSCKCYGYFRSYPLVRVKAQISEADAGFLADDKGTVVEKGKASASGAKPGADEWPQFLRDASRSNVYPTAIAPEKLAVAWQSKLPVQGGSRWREVLGGGDTLTAPVAANGLVCVAGGDDHAVHALDAKTGQVRWSYTSGGVIDTPPALAKGLAVFGSADGWVYALSQKDGALAWRTRLARNDSLRPIAEQLMSLWPVHGSVLVEGDTVVALAGWYSIEAEEMHMYGLSLADGSVKWEEKVKGLVTEGNGWYGRIRRGPNLVNRNEILGLVDGNVLGLDPATGKTVVKDGRWHFLPLPTFNVARSNPVGRVKGGPSVYTRESALWKNRRLDLLQGTGRSGGQLHLFVDKVRNLSKPGGNAPRLPKPKKILKAPSGHRWLTMLVAGDLALVAGKEGEKPCLWAYKTADLAPAGKVALPAAPVFRGLVASKGRLYISCADGSVVCLAPR